MTRQHRNLMACSVVVAAAGLAACSSEDLGPGIVVSVDLAEFAQQIGTLKIAISALPDGFVFQRSTSKDNVGVEREDVDGDGTLELVTKFVNPRSTVSFRIATGNKEMLDVVGHATAFDATKVIAGDDSAAPVQLPAGGRSAIALKLASRPGGVVGPTTHTTDIKTAPADVTVRTAIPAHFSSVAVCDVDDDGTGDLVLGAPLADNMNNTAAGAVYVLLGKNGLAADIDPANANTVMEFHFYGEFPGDQLGAAVACADLDGDQIGDLIVGAPGAANNTGRVYAVFGNKNIRTQAITPGATGAGAPDVTWETTEAYAGLGGILFADDLNADGNAEILVAAPASKRVHLLKNVIQTTAAPISVDGADHITFSNVSATSLTAGHLRNPTEGVDVVIGDSDGRRPTSTTGGGAIYAFADVKLDGVTQYDALSADASVGRTTIMYGDDNMLFGAALLALDTTGNGADLIVGAPGATNAAGAFYLYKNDNNIFGVAERAITDHPVIKNGPTAFGRFGTSLAGTPTGNAGRYSWDLVVGAPGTPRTQDRVAGAAYLFARTIDWSFPLVEQVFGAATTDQLGAIVAGGQVGGDKLGDLVTIAPNATSGADNTGVVYIIYGQARQ